MQRSATIHEAEDGQLHEGEYASCPPCHGGEACVMPGCTGFFFADSVTHDLTGWLYALDEGDVPVHDCRT